MRAKRKKMKQSFNLHFFFLKELNKNKLFYCFTPSRKPKSIVNKPLYQMSMATKAKTRSRKHKKKNYKKKQKKKMRIIIPDTHNGIVIKKRYQTKISLQKKKIFDEKRNK